MNISIDRAQSRLRAASLAVLLGWMLGVPAWAAETAEGPSIGTQLREGLWLGGYATLELSVPRSRVPAASPAPSPTSARAMDADGPDGDRPLGSNRTTLSLSHLSAILWWEPSARWKLLAEVDSQRELQIPAHDEYRDRSDAGAALALERVYADWRASDALTWRVGKFLTPIGRWNQDHPDPLTWTTSRPLLSHSAFPANTTGVMAFGSTSVGLSDLDYQIYVAPSQNWRAGASQDTFSRAVGARVVLPLGADAQLGFSLASFNQRDADTDRRRLGGLDLMWKLGRLSVQAELMARHGDEDYESSEHGGFVQFVYPLGSGWSGVLRLERLRYAKQPSVHSTVAGLVYKGPRHWVFKAEYDDTSAYSPALPKGWLVSVTGLF